MPDADLALPVAGTEVPLRKALDIVVGYCLGDEPQAWTKPPLGVGEGLRGLRRGAFAYRTYDCVLAAPTPRLEAIDILVADGLNGQMRAKDVAAVLSVADAVSEELAAVDANQTAFWDLRREEVATAPESSGSRAWPIWRAWTLLMGAAGIDIARTHKILHHKRPHVFPLVDNETYPFLAGRHGAWATIHDDLTTAKPAWERLEEAVNGVLADAGGAPLTRLRLHDILLWTRPTRRREIAEEAGRDYLTSHANRGTGST